MKEMNSKGGVRGAQEITETSIVPVIMAGGRSSRMGCDKAFLPWGCMNLLERLIREFSDFGALYVTSAKDGRITGFLQNIGYRLRSNGCDKEEYFLKDDLACSKTDGLSTWRRLANIKNLPPKITVLYDECSDRGPIEGLRQAAENIVGWFMAIAVDMPFVDRNFADYLRQFACGSFDAVVPFSNDREHPLCALYRAEGIRKFAKQNATAGIGKIRLLLDSVRTKYADISLSKFSDKVFFNANTPDEYENIKGNAPSCFSISGFKNSGKTTLAVKLINKFYEAGFAVGAVKHDGHDYEMDRNGTDTQKFTEAGALVSSIYSSNKWSINSSKAPKSLDCMIRATAKAYDALSEETPASLDIVVAEGDKQGRLPKIVLVSNFENAAQELESFGPNVICIAAPECAKAHKANLADAKIYSRDDIDGIFAETMRALVIIYPWLAAKKICRAYLPEKNGLQIHETD